MRDICFLKFDNTLTTSFRFCSVTKLKKTNIFHLFTLDLEFLEPKHGFRFILVVLYKHELRSSSNLYISLQEMSQSEATSNTCYWIKWAKQQLKVKI
jgi:hypothetical protein